MCPHGVLPMITYTGRLRPKGVPYSGLRIQNGKGFVRWSKWKGRKIIILAFEKALCKIFLTDAPYDCINLITKRYTKWQEYLLLVSVWKGNHFSIEGIRKEDLFCQKWHIKWLKGWTSGGACPLETLLWVVPPEHFAVFNKKDRLP